jgi:hypothetical protein
VRLVKLEFVGEEGSAFRQHPAAFGQDSDDGSVLQTLLLHPTNELLNIRPIPDGASVSLDCSIRMNRSTLPIGFSKLLQGIQQPLVLPITGRLVGTQGLIKSAIAPIRPDPTADRMSTGNGSRVFPTINAVDKGVFAVDVQSNLNDSIVVPQSWWFPHEV